MNRLLLILTILFISCQTDTELFNEVNKIAEFNGVYEPILIESGKEDGFFDNMMEYNILKIDTLSFRNLQNSIDTSDKFDKGKYYLNIGLDDYINRNGLDILNMSKSLVTENQFDKSYNLYLMSDRKTLVICKINH